MRNKAEDQAGGKHTPSDNRQGRAQNSKLKGVNNPKTSGDSFDETKREAFESRESGLNESKKKNEPRRGTDTRE